eukprot:gene8127-11005_t
MGSFQSQVSPNRALPTNSSKFYRLSNGTPNSVAMHSYPETSPMNIPRKSVAGIPSNFSSSVYPRSVSEACLDSSSKFRQLPCRTFVSVGSCPYRERCVYLHDPRITNIEAKTKTRKKNKEDVIQDSFFWPIMSYNQLCGRLDSQGQPHVVQEYHVPYYQNDIYMVHDRGLYSLWMHFVDQCQALTQDQQILATHGYSEIDSKLHTYGMHEPLASLSAPDEDLNHYTKQPRLQVFKELSRRLVDSNRICTDPTTIRAKIMEKEESKALTAFSILSNTRLYDHQQQSQLFQIPTFDLFSHNNKITSEQNRDLNNPNKFHSSFPILQPESISKSFSLSTTFEENKSLFPDFRNQLVNHDSGTNSDCGMYKNYDITLSHPSGTYDLFQSSIDCINFEGLSNSTCTAFESIFSMVENNNDNNNHSNINNNNNTITDFNYNSSLSSSNDSLLSKENKNMPIQFDWNSFYERCASDCMTEMDSIQSKPFNLNSNKLPLDEFIVIENHKDMKTNSLLFYNNNDNNNDNNNTKQDLSNISKIFSEDELNTICYDDISYDYFIKDLPTISPATIIDRLSPNEEYDFFRPSPTVKSIQLDNNNNNNNNNLYSTLSIIPPTIPEEYEIEELTKNKAFNFVSIMNNNSNSNNNGSHYQSYSSFLTNQN